MPKKIDLVTEKVKLNGVSVHLSHSNEFRLPKTINTEPRAINNRALKRMARQIIRL